ncbi:adenine nucleotide alpha hydrolases-like protein [Backusella circina FSU 941]|nr:adenine nucleotide alpha hydrolases-like protein [Backusella circina FSU 941]
MGLSITEKRRVALAYDGTPDAEKLFDWSVKNIIRPESDHLILLSAVQKMDRGVSFFSKKDASPTSPKPGELPVLTTTPTKVDQALEDVENPTARERLEDMANRLKSLNISSEEHVLWGDAKIMLPRFTEAQEVDLLIVGSRGLGVVKSVILGSVSDACLKNCPCPVLVVRNTTL